ncbi:MAG: biotin transporter BioY [Actinobacteria bacterium]|nr:biotin transporter BioY [Actinomycetota bacterium]
MNEETLNIKTGIPVSGSILANTLFKPVFSTVFALLLCISANSFIYLPFTPVPMTMQVLTVLLSAVMLGKYWAVISQIQYIAMGLIGLPVFAGFNSGIAALTGPTGGYIAGFTAGAFLAGYIYDKYREKNTALFSAARRITYPGKSSAWQNFISLPDSMALFLSCLAGLSVIYFFGCLHLTGHFYLMSYHSGSVAHIIKTAIAAGVAPFFIPDMLKIAIILNLYKIKGNHEKN